MTRKMFAMGLVLAALMGACGGDDGKKTRQACSDDTVCGGGVCFEQECYSACSETEPCAEADEVCVRKEKAGAEVDLCVVAADFFDAHVACVDVASDCADLVAGVCQIVGCHDGRCVVEPKTDGIECVQADGEPDVCTAGHCGERSSGGCDDPVGTWRASITHPENQGQCSVDGQVTQQVTLTISPATDARFSATVETTNNVDPETGECFTHREEWTGGVFEGDTMTLVKEAQEQRDCDGTPTTVNTSYGFEGALTADCSQIVGTSWKEPTDSCDPESGRYEMPGTTFTKVNSAARPTY